MSEPPPAGPSPVHPIEHWVLHVDMDQFLAAVELLRHPELAGRPVIVGGDGDPTKRGVVSTASYEAREHGVGSGMALRIAARKCPGAVFLPVDRAAYDEASERVMATLRGLEWGGRPVVLEVLGWDEAFLAAGPRPDARTGTSAGASQLGRGRPWAGAAEQVAADADAQAAGTAATPEPEPTPVVEAGQGSLPPVNPPEQGSTPAATRPGRGPAPGAGKGAPGGPSVQPPPPAPPPAADAGEVAGRASAHQLGTALTAGPPHRYAAPSPQEPTSESGVASSPDPTATTDPLAFAAHIRARVLEETRLHCSVGIGDNKLRAKIATEFGKPRGAYVLTEDTWFEVMGDKPTRALWGIGSKTAKKLAALGIDTVIQLATSDARILAAELGPTMGPWYHRIGRGVSDAHVSAEPWVPRAHGRETTFQEDLEDWDRIAEEVRALTRQVKADIDKEGRKAARVGLKLRYKPFFTVSRSKTLREPTDDVEVLAAEAVSLLERVEHDRPVRLLGVRLEMVPPEGGYR